MIKVKFIKNWVEFKRGQITEVTCNVAHGLLENGFVKKYVQRKPRKKRVRKYTNKRIKKYKNK